MKVILIRHGETDWNAQGRLQGREDVPLNEAGRQQAIAAGKALRHYPFSGPRPLIIASPLQRAVETARLIADQLGIHEEPLTDASLLERDYGLAAGLTEAERGGRFEGLEDRDAAENRIVQGLTRLARTYAPRDLIVVSHGEISHIFLAKLRREATRTGKSALKNAALSSLIYEEPWGFQIEYYNQTAAELESELAQRAVPSEWVLASASPRRRELLSVIHESFSIETSDAEERLNRPVSVPRRLAADFWAQAKARDIAQRHPDRLVIGSDTAVQVMAGGVLRILGKPDSLASAKLDLELLSGREHTVRTACCLCYRGRVHTFAEETKVQFYTLTEKEIAAYIATGESRDKAGSYAIQGQGALLVKKIDGDYYNVVGLPIARLKREIDGWLLKTNCLQSSPEPGPDPSSRP